MCIRDRAGASFGIFHNGIEVFASPGAPNNATCSTAQADHTVNVQNYSFTPADITINAVSYTHLTLPTSDLV